MRSDVTLAWIKRANSALAAETSTTRAFRASDTARARPKVPTAPALSMPNAGMSGTLDTTAGARSLPTPPV